MSHAVWGMEGRTWHRIAGPYGRQQAHCGELVNVEHVYHCLPEAGPHASPSSASPADICPGCSQAVMK